MAIVVLALLALFSQFTIYKPEVVGENGNTHEHGINFTVPKHYLIPRKGTGWDTISFKSCPTWVVYGSDDVFLTKGVVMFSAYDWLLSFYSFPFSPGKLRPRHSFNQSVSTHSIRKTCMVALLLLMSGDIEFNPCLNIDHLATPSDFKSRSGLGVIHLNVRSLLPKLDMVKIWAKSSDTDILVLSQTWLKKSITDKEVAIKGYNLFSCDHPRKGGGVAIYVKQKFCATIQSSLSLSRQFEFLALKLELCKGHFITVVGCYRPPSANSETLSALNAQLLSLDFNEILLTGDLNWDWLSSISDCFKSGCYLTQLVNETTRPNIKCPQKSSY